MKSFGYLELMVGGYCQNNRKVAFEVRQAQNTEIAFVAEIESDCFPADRLLGLPELEALVWHNETILLVAEGASGRLLGFVCCVEEGSLEHIISIAVTQSARRQGVASGLLASAVEMARSRGAKLIYAEVRESNKASQELFRSLGFAVREKVGGYYSNPDEDAIIVQFRPNATTKECVQK